MNRKGEKGRKIEKVGDKKEGDKRYIEEIRRKGKETEQIKK